MKHYLLLAAALIGAGTAQAQCSKSAKSGTEATSESAGTSSCCHHGGRSGKKIEIAAGYNNGTPLGSLGAHTNNLQAFNFRIGYIVPGTRGRVNAGLEMNAGNYASFTKTQVFGFNGTSTPTPVAYRSSVTSMNLGVRYDVFRTKSVSMFGGVKAGYSYFASNLEVQNAEDPYGCAPAQETRELISDYAAQGGAEAGANFDAAGIFHKMPRNTFMLQARVGYLFGSNVDYINVRNSEDATTHHHGTTETGGTALEMQFVNLGTGDQHMHEVARVFTSPLQYLEGGISLLIRF